MSALRDEIARAIDPDAFDDSKPKSTRQVAVLQWSVRRKMANDAASAVLPIVREREAEALRDAANDWDDPPEGRAFFPRTGAYVFDWLHDRADRTRTEPRS